MASTLPPILASSSALVIDILAQLPAEIVTRIVDNLHPSLVYFHVFLEPKTSSVQSSSEECQRETIHQMLDEASINAETSGKKRTVLKHAPRSLWKVWLTWSVSHGYPEITSTLLCVDGMASYLNGSERCFDKLLFPAAKHQNMVLLGLLLGNGASPDILDDNNGTPLHVATENGNIEAVEMLVVQYRADVNRLGSAGNTPLMWAIENDNMDMIRIFLQSPLLNLNKPSLWGQTALHMALSKGKPEIAELLLTFSGDDVEEHKDTHGRTPLMLCLAKMAGLKDMSAYMPTFKKLLTAKGVDLQTFSKEYETILEDVFKDYDIGFWQELVEQFDS
ncbi:ankyrin repeat protein [Trichoderma chlorosporum]